MRTHKASTANRDATGRGGARIPESSDRDARGFLLRLPRTSKRSEQMVFAKLLTHVDPDAANGFGFEGAILRPGSLIAESSLWPTPEHPAGPVLLEYAGRADRGYPKKPGGDSLYVLWRYDRAQRIWIELARAEAAGWEWAMALRSVAVQALAQPAPAARESRVDLNEVAARIGELLDREFRILAAADRARVIGVLHDRFAGEAVR